MKPGGQHVRGSVIEEGCRRAEQGQSAVTRGTGGALPLLRRPIPALGGRRRQPAAADGVDKAGAALRAARGPQPDATVNLGAPPQNSGGGEALPAEPSYPQRSRLPE